MEKDGLIQRFEFTFDLAWKVMQDYLLYAGYDAIKGPRSCIKQMAADELIDAFIWEDMLNVRNQLSHIYNEEKSRDFLDKIVSEFNDAFIVFKLTMQKK